MSETMSKELPSGEHEQRRADWTHFKEVLHNPIELKAMRRFYRDWAYAWHRGYDMGWIQRASIGLSQEATAQTLTKSYYQTELTVVSEMTTWDILEKMITMKAQKVNNETKLDLHTVDELLLMVEVIGNLLSHAAEQDEEMYNHIVAWQENRDNGPVGSAEVPE